MMRNFQVKRVEWGISHYQCAYCSTPFNIIRHAAPSVCPYYRKIWLWEKGTLQSNIARWTWHCGYYPKRNEYTYYLSWLPEEVLNDILDSWPWTLVKNFSEYDEFYEPDPNHLRNARYRHTTPYLLVFYDDK